MKNLNFTYVAAKNFLCFGPDGIELKLNKYGKVVLIRGVNFDRNNPEDHELDKRVASNGSGKSAVADILVYALYGRTVKSPKKITHSNIINNKSKKGLYVEVRWDNYRIVRTRKPDGLKLWESENGDWSHIGNETWENEHEISLGGIPATQKLVEQKIGLNYDSFINVAIFTDNNAGCFLELDGPAKREVVENLLSLDKFRQYFDIAKKEKNNIKNNIKIQIEGYQYLLQSLEYAENNVAQLSKKESNWKLSKEQELKKVIQLIKEKEEELKRSDVGIELSNFYEAQEKIEILNKKSNDLIDKDEKVKQILTQTRDALDRDRNLVDDLLVRINRLNHAIVESQACVNKNELLIKPLKKLEEGTKCPTCFGSIHKDNFADVLVKAQKDMETCLSEIQEKSKEKEFLQKEHQVLGLKVNRYKEAIKLGESKSNAFSKQLIEIRREISKLSTISKPDSNAREKIIEQQLSQLKNEINDRQKEIASPSPFAELLASAVKESQSKKAECLTKKNEVDDLEKKLPYYDFFVNAFSEEGVRKFVIDGILPALNSRIAYWLHFLIDSKIKLLFNNQFEETIERNPADGDPFVYHAMSGGERRMLNLSASQSFAYIMMLNSGASPSCVFLDEVTTNIDQIGVQGVYNMIMELSREKQIFITTHDHDLLEMLGGCDMIELQKKDGYTRLV